MAKAKPSTAPAVSMTRSEAAAAGMDWPSVDSPDVHFPREISDDKRLSDAVAWLTWRQLQRERVQTELKARIAALESSAAAFLDEAGCNAPRFDEAEALVERYVCKHRRRLMAETKTLALPGGVVKLRTSTPSLCPTHRHDDKSVLSILDNEFGATQAVNAALERVGARPWLRAKLELDKTGIKTAAERGDIGSEDLAKRFLRIEQTDAVTVSRAA